MKAKHLLLSAALLVSVGSITYAAEQAHQAPHWGYEGKEGVEHWGQLDKSYHSCAFGQAQSPVNLQASVEAELPELDLAYQPFNPEVVNNGHTIQVNAPAGSSFTVDHHTYSLVQFHFHTPSEYHIEGKAFPMELHLVHKRDDGALGVVGVMLEEGAENAELEKIWKNLPQKSGEKHTENVSFDVEKLLPSDHAYFRLMGSLTTPPCSEGVNWFVLEDSVSVSKEQISAFQKLFPMNARPLQAVNNRLLVKGIR